MASLYALKPMNLRSLLTSTWSLNFFFSALCAPSSLASMVSAIAYSLTGWLCAGTFRALATAPLPRPPHPIIARRIVLLPAAKRLGDRLPSTAAPAAKEPPCLRNCRRLTLNVSID